MNKEKKKEYDDKITTQLIDKLKDMKFFIVRWSGDDGNPSSNLVDNPKKFFNEIHYDDETLIDLADLDIGEKYNCDELFQDIEILRYE